MALKAFLTALSAKAKDNEILVFDELKLAAPKTARLSDSTLKAAEDFDIF